MVGKTADLTDCVDAQVAGASISKTVQTTNALQSLKDGDSRSHSGEKNMLTISIPNFRGGI